jgi:murein DD-endopeptidase MepM/ murein hydrolase activator NlpD
MHPLIRAAAACLFFALAGSAAPDRSLSGPAASAARGGRVASEDGLSAVCPAGMLPDGDACVTLPMGDEGADELLASTGAHRDKRGQMRSYDQIPRRPERPAAYEAYRYPVPLADNEPLRVGGYDLDLPDSVQRRGRRFSFVGHGGVDLLVPRGTEVRAVALEHQDGDAQVIFSGKLFGTTVITRHTLREGGRLRDYIALYGHLASIAAGIEPGRPAAEGTVLGYVGDTGSEGIVHLHLEVRRVREGVDLEKVAPERVVTPEIAVVCDPRNVLPVK